MKEWVKKSISLNVEDDINYMKDLLKDNSDIVFRQFDVYQWKAAFVYIDGMADKILLDNFVLEPLMERNVEIEKVEDIKEKILAVSDIREVEDLSKGIDAMLSGDTLMLIDGLETAYVVATRFWPARSVSEPSGETVIRGAREGFTETIRFNTVLVRRRIRDTRFKVVPKELGTRSKTDVAIMYIDDIVNQEVLDELNKRIGEIDIDAVLDSGYVEQMIEDDNFSPFPQIQSTERPDVVAAALYEGRVAVLVDNSPFAIIAPATLPNLLQSPDDYYQRWMHSSLVRLIRTLAIILSITLPALYVAVTSFHTAIIPTELAYSIAGSREGVPFPAFIEALIMDVSLALLLEAIARLPKPIAATIGIVGGLIIGQAAVSAGIVSPIMIIIVGVTAITEFITPNYGVSSALRLIRFIIIIASAVIGLYGIMLVLLVVLIHLIRLKSFGIPYLAPIVNPDIKDFKDMYVRLPFKFFKERPKYMKTKDKIRQK
ncbi:spore germination protein [Clostridium ganghwense]|uniref:Spore germination protein n=1 Tax=Clostridium ganghwense TaxID=312089 RepID=A0ABT4CPE9_9CLOT|nr:spore germination protein [Clostridium ganghwense]MCY6369854.1 spore germination protein [Clostridium ganghwense]